MQAEKNSKIILTDGITWTFYCKESRMSPIMDPISLGELVYKCKLGRNNRRVYERDSSNKPIIETIKFNENDTEFKRLVIDSNFAHKF